MSLVDGSVQTSEIKYLCHEGRRVWDDNGFEIRRGQVELAVPVDFRIPYVYSSQMEYQ
jgi:hypothetical protein